MKFWVKSQEVDQTSHVEMMVNVCDEKLLGKSLTKDAKVSEYFYKGQLLDMKEMLEAVSKGTLINLLGNNCVNALIKLKLVSEKNVKIIGKQKHAILIQSAG